MTASEGNFSIAALGRGDGARGWVEIPDAARLVGKRKRQSVDVPNLEG